MMREKLRSEFRSLKGGLFDDISKADVGAKADEMNAAGVDMLCWADPFFPDKVIPSHVKEAVFSAYEKGIGEHYTTPIGSAVLKEVLGEKLHRENNLIVNPERNIIITPGSDSALFFTLFPLISIGDEVLIVDPSYPNNFQVVSLLGGKPISVPVTEQDGFRLNIVEFEKRVTARTKAVLLTNPNNPTTVVYSEEELSALADFIKAHDLIAVCDQAFEDIVFDEREMVTLASLEGMWERTITIFSISKGMALSGLRVGYIVADDVLMDILFASAVSVVGATNSAAQAAAVAVYENPQFIEEYNKIFERRRDYVYDQMNQIPGVTMQKPQSAFLSWINISQLGTSDEIVDYLVQEAKVFVNAGHYYGKGGEGYIRLVHGCFSDEERLKAAVLRVKEALCKKGGHRR